MNGRMSFRLCTTILILAIATLLLASCGQPAAEVTEEEAQPPEEAVEEAAEEAPEEVPEEEPVTLQFLGCAYVGDSMQPLFDAFEEANPGTEIEFQQVPFDNLNDVLTAELSAGSPTPDVFWADQPRVPGLAERGWLYDFTDLLPEFEGQVFEDSIVESSWNGNLYALPISTSEMTLYYNLDHFEAAGIEPPSTDPNERWTWEETVEAAKKAQDAGATWGLVLDQVDRYYQLQPLGESAGGGSGLTGPDNLTPDLTNDGWIQAMEFYYQIHEEGVSPRGVPWEQLIEMWNTGQIAILVSGPWAPFYAMDYEDLRYGIAPHPYFGDGTAITPTGSWSVGVNPNSEHVEEAIEFAKFASMDPQGNLLFNTSEGSPPALFEAYDEFWEQDVYKTQPTLAELKDIVEFEVKNTAVPRPRTIGYLEFETIMGQAFSDIRNGSNPEEVLERAEQELDEAFARYK